MGLLAFTVNKIIIIININKFIDSKDQKAH